jgi:FlaG/FlaF family flagellin (archaellin)
MQKYLYIIFIFSFITIMNACSKSNVIDNVLFQKVLLAGTSSISNTKHIWQYDSCKIDGINQTLTIYQRSYKKSYTYDGYYSDTDNNIGKWEINTLNKLKEKISYQGINKIDSITYDIISINAAQLNLSRKLENGQIVVYIFKISY